MLSYDAFKREVVGHVKEYLPEEYQDAEVFISSVRKVNQNYDVLNIAGPGMPQVAPVIKVTEFYERIEKGEEVSDVLAVLADTYEKNSMGREQAEQVYQAYSEKMLDRDFVKQHVVMQLINRQENREYLENLAHTDYLDMSVVYRIAFRMDEDGMQSVTIGNELLDNLGMDVAELHEMAMENTRKLFPVQVMPMQQKLVSLLSQETSLPAEMVEEGLDDVPLNLYVLTNRWDTNGAAVMLYDDILQDLSEQFGDDLIVIPSSIHEALALPASDFDARKMAEVVQEVNQTTVPPEDRLSNSVYAYSRGSKKLEIAAKSDKALIASQEKHTQTQNKPVHERKQGKGR